MIADGSESCRGKPLQLGSYITTPQIDRGDWRFFARANRVIDVPARCGRRPTRTASRALGDFRKYQEPGVCISRELENRPELKGRFTLTRSTFGLDERGALIFQGH